jgi:hypothetical protein
VVTTKNDYAKNNKNEDVFNSRRLCLLALPRKNKARFGRPKREGLNKCGLNF